MLPIGSFRFMQSSRAISLHHESSKRGWFIIICIHACCDHASFVPFFIVMTLPINTSPLLMGRSAHCDTSSISRGELLLCCLIVVVVVVKVFRHVDCHAHAGGLWSRCRWRFAPSAASSSCVSSRRHQIRSRPVVAGPVGRFADATSSRSWALLAAVWVSPSPAADTHVALVPRLRERHARDDAFTIGSMRIPTSGWTWRKPVFKQ
jgi:hypothetical protein